MALEGGPSKGTPQNIGSFSPKRFQRVLRSSPNKGEFLELIEFCKPRNSIKKHGEDTLDHLNLPPFLTIAAPPTAPPPPAPIEFFENAQSSPLNIQGKIHQLPKNPEKFCPCFIYGESRTAEEHVHAFKELCNRKEISHQVIMCRLFPYTQGEFSYNWYLNFS